jgi:signal transduction histidine kinase
LKSLYLRIYLTVVLALGLFAGVSGWLVQRHLDEQRARAEDVLRDRMSAWAELLQRTLPPPQASALEQQQALNEWSQRLRVPLAMDDARGVRVAASDNFLRREREAGPAAAARLWAIRLDDGRTLWITRPGAWRAARELGGLDGAGDTSGTRNPGGPWSGLQGGGPLGERGLRRPEGPAGPGLMAPLELRVPWFGVRGLPDGAGLVALLMVLFVAVAAGAYPVVRRLTRRLEALQQGVEAFGAGALHQRVAEDGRDEVAAVGASFNRAAARIEALLRTHQSLLANASHELRSPLARLKMAVSMLDDAQGSQRAVLKREIDTNIAELDALVEEVLLASRLDGGTDAPQPSPVALLPLLAEEAARVNAEVQATLQAGSRSPSGPQPGPAEAAITVAGEERLLRRALRNLLENAKRHGGGVIEVSLQSQGHEAVVSVCDRGPGVPALYLERIFEPFFRLPGQSERDGGVGLGLALVRQIADRHGGHVRCLLREGGGSCFELRIPMLDVREGARR